MAVNPTDSDRAKPRGFSVLLSAYACEPGQGSEAGVGWSWATHLAHAGCQVHVITRKSNRDRIEAHLEIAPIVGLSFSYIDVPRWLSFWKRGTRGVHLYYLLWQVAAYFLARSVVRSRRFDLVHHVTFVTARFPSMMGLLGLPFCFGPLAGGEYAPAALWRYLGASGVIKESLRFLSMHWWRFSPSLNLSFWSADRILTTSEGTRRLLPSHAHSKADVMLGIGWDPVDARSSDERCRNDHFEILFAGNFLYWKGMELGLEAVGRLASKYPNLRLTMVGKGSSEKRWRQIAANCNLDGRIIWRPSVPRAEFLAELEKYDVMLFPSLHDSGGMVVLEAMAAGVPVVCLDFGGPGVLVDGSCGIKVAAATREEAVAGLCDALSQLASDPVLASDMGRAGARRAREVFAWPRRIERMLRYYEEITR